MSVTAVRPTFRVIGQPVVRGDVVDKVQARVYYAADWELPGLLHGKVVRSPYPSARLRRIDVEAARRLPGVVAVLTAADVPQNRIHEDPSGLGLLACEQTVLAEDRVRYAGEPYALIAAETPEIAAQAAERIVVDWEPLPGVFDPEEALGPSAPQVHDGGNLLIEWKVRQGDIEAARAEAEVVVEREYRTQHVDHAYLEPECGVAWIDHDGTLTVRSSTQVIEHYRQIAEILGLAQNRVRLIAPYLGGGFGGKEDMTVEPFVALLAWKTRRPVKLLWTRQESLVARPKRHPMIQRYRVGARRDGTLVFMQVDITGDAGAWALLSPRVMFAAAVTATGPYRVPNVRVDARAVFTNNVPTSAFRGFGAMQVVFGYDQVMQELAETLGLDPAEVRSRNFVRKGEAIGNGEVLDTEVAVSECLDRVLERLGPPPRPSAAGRRVGRGYACNMQPYGRTVWFGDTAACWIGIEPDGSLLLRAGVPDLGGGQAAILCQIAAEVLGVPLDSCRPYFGDSALTPLTGGTFATRQLYNSGNAALQCARELRDKLAGVAAAELGAAPEELEFADGRVSVAGDASRSVGIGRLAQVAKRHGVAAEHLSTFHAETGAPWDHVRGTAAKTFPDFTFGCHGCDVEIDDETGEVRLLRYVACHDVGRALNPQSVEGQVQGGAVQGIGYALSEEVVLDQGNCLTGSFAQYLIPCSEDLPDIEVILVESGEGKGPFGARGIGEPCIAPPSAAVANAVADALGGGRRVRQLPITPQRVLEALGR